MGEERSGPAQGRTASRPAAPSPREAPEEVARALGDSALGAKLSAVQASDDATATHRRFELAEPVDDAGAERGPAQWVQRRRVSPGWLRPYTTALVTGDLLLASLAAAGGALGSGAGESGWAAIPFALVFVAAATVARVYEHRYVGAGAEEFRRLAVASVVVLAVLATTAYALRVEARGLVLTGSALAGVLTLLWHATARQVLYALRRHGHCRHRVVVIGLERSVDGLIQRLRRQPDGDIDVVAACVRRRTGDTVAGVPIAGTPDQARGVVRRHHAHAILITAWSEVSEEELRRLSWEVEGSGIQLYVAPRLTEVAAPRLHLRTIGGVPLLHIEEPEFTGLRRVAKIGLDRGLALAAVILLAPVLVAVAVAVRLDSPGPVLFRQERIGRDSRPFRMTKFRSMYVDAEQRLEQLAHLNEHGAGPLFKMKQDPRVTRVGAVLRRYSLDELPQLFDVLRGAMSLVGPRPPLAQEVAAYEQDVHRRLLVTPGITGLWQVSGRSDLSWEESVRLDLSYVENWSLGLDLSIIARTVVAVLARRGAY